MSSGVCTTGVCLITFVSAVLRPAFQSGRLGPLVAEYTAPPSRHCVLGCEHPFETAAGRLRRICCSCRVHQSRAFEVVAVFGERCLPVSVSGYLDGAVCGSASFRWEQESPLCPAQHRVLPRYVGQPAEGRTEPLLLAAGQPVHLRAGTLHYYHTSLSGVLDGFSIFLCRPRPTIYLIDFTFYNYHYCCW